MKTIHAIAPVVETKSAGITREAVQASVDDLAVPGVLCIEAMLLDSGPSSVENEIDHALCIPDLLRKGLEAAAAGSSGIFIDCAADPGVEALRCALDIPVVGAGEAAFHHAAKLGHRFSVIDIGADTAAMVEMQIAKYGLSSRFASLRSTGIPVEGIGHSAHIAEILADSALLAIRQDHADVIVLGCTGFAGCAKRMEDILRQNGYAVPVIDPVPVAVRTLIMMVFEGHCHSKTTWPSPTVGNKRLGGFPDQDILQTLYRNRPGLG